MLHFLLNNEAANLFVWDWAPSVLIGFGLWTLAYIFLTSRGHGLDEQKRRPTTGGQIAFHAATVIATVALISPIDHLGDEYLFSAHMIQHLLLMFIAAPLWLIGTPRWVLESVIPARFAPWARRLTRPLAAYLIFALSIILWHIPYLYNLALEHEWIHITEHLIYMAAAVIGWWPIASPNVSFAPRATPPVRMLYVFLLIFPCAALAAILTFAQAPLYPFYTTAPRILGLSVLADQQLGGLLMWVPTHMILLLALSISFFQWFNDPGNGSDIVPVHTST